MNATNGQSRVYTFIKAVVAITAFIACFYLLLVCYCGTYRLISDIGNVRALFFNPVLILSLVLAIVIAGGVFTVRSEKVMGFLAEFDEERKYERTVKVLKFVVFAECIVFVLCAIGMDQRVDQYSVQKAAYGFSWNETETFTPPGYLGIYPNNLGMSIVLYLLSFVAGHYNNAVIMVINAILVPFIYTDMADIGGEFGLSRKSRLLVMISGMLFLPLQAKTMIIYGDVPGLFLACRAMRIAVSITRKKSSVKDIVAVVIFNSLAYVFKNNYIIFSMAIAIYLVAELLRQRRVKELYIPLAVIVAPILLNKSIGWIVGAAVGKSISSGANKLSWIAMGMQEEAGTYNGYNAFSYLDAGFDSTLQGETVKKDISESLRGFLAEPNSAINFYARKVMIQWSDPTHCCFEFLGRNVYLDKNASPLAWFLASPKTVRAVSSFLKVFQLLMFTGGTVSSVNVMKKKETPAVLLLMTFVGGYFFHLIWEAAPTYSMMYMVVLIPVGVSGLVILIRKISSLKIKELAKAKIGINAIGLTFFVAGALIFLLAAMGIGTAKVVLAEGRTEYKNYMNDTITCSRAPIAEGEYILKSSVSDLEEGGIRIELIRFAGQYRMRMILENVDDDVFLTDKNGSVKADWFSYDSSQVFCILRNGNGTYSICKGENSAMCVDPDTGKITIGDFVNYTYIFNMQEYNDYISEHPNMTWNFVPA